MSGDNYKIQASIKFGPGGSGMLNLRADSADELRESTVAAVGVCAELAVLVEAFNTEFSAVSAVAASFPGTTVQQQYPQQQPQQQYPAQQAQGALCPHGPMTYLEAKDGSWKGHFCPLQKGDPNKCKPRYVR